MLCPAAAPSRDLASRGMELARYWKLLPTIIIGVVAQAVAQGLIDGAAAAWAAVTIGVLTTVGVYVVPRNKM